MILVPNHLQHQKEILPILDPPSSKITPPSVVPEDERPFTRHSPPAPPQSS